MPDMTLYQAAEETEAALGLISAPAAQGVTSTSGFIEIYRVDPSRAFPHPPSTPPRTHSAPTGTAVAGKIRRRKAFVE